MTTPLGIEVRLEQPFDQAMAWTREALKDEGFGVLTEIDMQAAFKEKLGLAFRSYVILGACHPPLAHRALSADPEVGLLLPCNVTVEAGDTGGTVVRLLDPERLMEGSGLSRFPELAMVAKDAAERLRRVAKTLNSRP